ncbi:MAG: hypothetical protein VKL42_08860 [Snowella sp.]|nr:hypothetical protein [Snowella sp.]
METLTFAGIKGTIKEVSPEGNFVTVELFDRVSIVGTFSNQWGWDEQPDEESGFVSFITYIGTDGTVTDIEKLNNVISEHNGYIRKGEEVARPSKRTSGYPYEVKVRGLSADSIKHICTNLIFD